MYMFVGMPTSTSAVRCLYEVSLELYSSSLNMDDILRIQGTIPHSIFLDLIKCKLQSLGTDVVVV